MLVSALSIIKPAQIVNPLCVATLILCFVGCKKTEGLANASPQSSATPAQPAPTRQVPSSSAAQSLGLFAYPQKGQSHDQQLTDEADCYDSAQQQSGVSPNMPAPQPPSSAQVQAAEAQAAESAAEAKGGRARGAARGAAGGALVGAVGGNAGAGAAVGATVGTVRGGRQQRQANETSQQQASSQAGAHLQQQYRSQKTAYDQQMNTLKRAFSACMDSRGYSVK